MKWSIICVVLILAATICSVSLRLPQLKQRPMHGDEAVHAFKFGELLEDGFYDYDPYEYHGPTLNYLTLIPAWAGRAQKSTDLSETTLRIVPVFFGVMLLLLILLIADGLGRTSAVCAAVLTAISPAMVYYSRYYIQEMLLVCFTFGVIASGYRYTRSKSIKWAILAGIFLGLMNATKETCIIAYGSILLALVLLLLMPPRQSGSVLNTLKAIKPCHLIAALVAAAVVSVLFFSSFLSNPTGILDSVRTYTTYFDRAGQSQLHIHPWYFYLKMLLYYKYGPGPFWSFWSEGMIVILAGVGFVIAIRGKGPGGVNFHMLRFIAFYTLAMTVVYSVIPYKTPWCLLGFLHGHPLGMQADGGQIADGPQQSVLHDGEAQAGVRAGQPLAPGHLLRVVRPSFRRHVGGQQPLRLRRRAIDVSEVMIVARVRLVSRGVEDRPPVVASEKVP